MEVSDLKMHSLAREIAPGVNVTITLCSSCHAPLHVTLGRSAVNERPLCLECARDVVAVVYERMDRFFGKVPRSQTEDMSSDIMFTIREKVNAALTELWTSKTDTDPRHGNGHRQG